MWGDWNDSLVYLTSAAPEESKQAAKEHLVKLLYQ